jgi:hypothetical protein
LGIGVGMHDVKIGLLVVMAVLLSEFGRSAADATSCLLLSDMVFTATVNLRGTAVEWR